MKEIKFRAWNTKQKKMYYLPRKGSVGRNTIFVLGCADLMNWNKNSVYHVNNFEVMQCSGVRDRNEVEVYENDIVREGREFPFEVVFINGAFVLKSDIGTPIGCLDLLPELEVIGNRYENPELLGE